MARLLALEWDTREARAVIGRSGAGGIVVEEAFVVDLPETADQDLGQRLAVALAPHNLGRCETLVALPRGKTELRTLSVPPAPDGELPDLVRFQALRQFSALSDDWPLDFVRIGVGEDQQFRVLAAAISPEVLAATQATCHAAQLVLKRLILRPCAAATLLQARLPDERCRLLVELLSEEVDLTVLSEGQVVFPRSVRLPAQELGTALVGEIRRTIAAAQNQLEGRRIEQVVLCGGSDQTPGLEAQLQEQLGLEVIRFDPFAGVDMSRGQGYPAYPGRFAALLGMLHEESGAAQHGIDFVNPRRKPVPPDLRRRYLALAAGVLAVVLLFVGLITWQLKKYDQRIQDLQTRSREWDQTVKDSEALKNRMADIDTFVAGDITLLDELDYLSLKFPPADQAIMDQAIYNANTRASGGGQLIVEGYVREPGKIKVLEDSLRDERHEVSGAGGQFDERQKELRWRFKETITIAAPDVEEVEEAADNE